MTYQRFQNTAKRLTEKYNTGALVLIKIAPGSGPDWNPGEPTETPHAFKGTLFGVSEKYVDGTLVVASDQQCTMPGGGAEPTTSDELMADGERHQIVKVERIPSAGIAAAYIVIVRK